MDLRIIATGIAVAFAIIALSAVTLYLDKRNHPFLYNMSKKIARNHSIPTGTISIRIVPHGLEIDIDQESTGLITPAVIQNIPIGKHTVKLRRANFPDVSVTVDVLAHKTTEVIKED
jgi:hypothetical protein